MTKTGRNDPCPCGSGKKYKQCCLKNQPIPGTPRKFKASWIPSSKAPNLMERTFGKGVTGEKEEENS